MVVTHTKVENLQKNICISTRGYCKARGCLSLVTIKNITKYIGKKDENKNGR